MLTCQSCGGTNPGHATRCEYCDQPLAGKKLVEVAWSARTSEGATGEGRISLETPGDTDTAQVRSVAEAAFAAAVDALGPDASQEQVRGEMQQRLGSLLPAEYKLASVELTSYSAFLLVAETPKPKPTSAGAKIILVMGTMMTMCCLSTSAMCVLAGWAEREQAGQIKGATVIDPQAPGDASGWVCIEGTVAVVDSPLVVKGPPLEEGTDVTLIHCLYQHQKVVKSTVKTHRRADGSEYTTTSKSPEESTHVVNAFRLGKVVVKPTNDPGQNTKWLNTEKLPYRQDGNLEYRETIVRAETPLTVTGLIRDGVLTGRAGEKLTISDAPDKVGLENQLRASAETSSQMGYIGLVVGVLLALFTFFLHRKA